MFSSNVQLGYVLKKTQKVYSTRTSLVPGIIDFVWFGHLFGFKCGDKAG